MINNPPPRLKSKPAFAPLLLSLFLSPEELVVFAVSPKTWGETTGEKETTAEEEEICGEGDGDGEGATEGVGDGEGEGEGETVGAASFSKTGLLSTTSPGLTSLSSSQAKYPLLTNRRRWMPKSHSTSPH